MKAPTILSEAKRLHALGFAILWIKPNSKMPVENMWTTGPRKSWAELEKTYTPGNNVGVRLGSPSKIVDKYLAVIDIDIKSTEKKHLDEAEQFLTKMFPSLPYTRTVLSGRGNGSGHLYVLTDKPEVPHKLWTSGENVKVMMPSAPIGRKQKEALGPEAVSAGWRLRPAWEIAVMGEGQQVVLPPSTHPDTGRLYSWKIKVESNNHLLLLNFGNKEKIKKERTATNDFVPEIVDLAFCNLDAAIIDEILYADVDDRSATLFKVVIAMIKDGWTDHQIMSVLTDQTYELAKASYDHAKTESRARAANWVFNYTIKKARSEVDAREIFAREVLIEETTPLSDAHAEDQAKRICASVKWQDGIERNGTKGANAGCPRATLKNLILIFENEVSVDVFRRDDFAIRDFYGHSTPWGGKKNAAITDDDAIKIKVWLGVKYRFEPKKELIYEAMTYLAEKNAFNPVKEELEALPEWDGVNRLDFWLAKHFEAEGCAEYLAQVFRKWVVAAIFRCYRPGTKFDWMPIFEGPQGVGKSSLGRLLFGDKYFVDWLPDLNNKDSALALQGAWPVEFGELASLPKSELGAAKAFITRTIDKVRPPYGRKTLEIPRRCVFYGTTNSETYLRDDSGNRRFKPVKVGQLDFEMLRIEREQLLAEALFIFKNGLETPESLELDGAAKIFEAEIQGEKMVEDDSEIMRELIFDFIKKSPEEHKKAGINWGKFKLQTLFESFGPLGRKKGDNRDRQLASKALRALGAKKWKSDGTNFWELENVKSDLGIGSGISKNTPIPAKNTSVYNN